MATTPDDDALAAPPVTPPPSACEQVARSADRLAQFAMSDRLFLRHLAWECGGVRPGVVGLWDLALAGRNRVRGGGFRRRFDDRSPGQARHFVGTAASALALGVRPTRWISVYLRRDPIASPDGALGEAALELVVKLRRDELSQAEVGDWIRHRVCAAQSSNASG